MEVLADKLVEYIAQTKGIQKSQAAKIIDKCIKKVSADKNIGYNQVYKILYSFTGLASCLAGSCSNADLEKCAEMCHCVIYQNNCAPRYLPDAILINQDPDKWILTCKDGKAISTHALEQLVEYASYLYYNYDGGGLTDNAFEALEYHLNKRLKYKGRKWEKIGAPPIEKLRTKLPYPMASLEKIKPGTSALRTFLARAPDKGMVWSDKLDGVSGLVVYSKGTITGMYTRGDGSIGGDVLYLKDYISLPQVQDSYFVVRGEFILPRKTWIEKYAESGYANPRSFVSAKINSGYVSSGLTDIQFVAYQIVDWSEKGLPEPSKAFRILIQKGFETPAFGIFPKNKAVLVFDVMCKYRKRREESMYNIDGLVLAVDKPLDPEQVGNPIDAKAFKMTLEEQLRNTKITNVEWNITRHGRYFPKAIFESVFIDGVRLHKASAHNARYVQNMHLGKGAKIVVTRSGDVIPAIKNVIVEQAINPILPLEPTDKLYFWSWSDTGVDIVLDNIEHNPDVHKKRIEHFFTTIQTPGLGEGGVKKLYDAGYKTIKAITLANKDDFQKIKGFGVKRAQSLYDNIHNTMRKTRMDRYYVALTTKKSVSRVTLKQVIQEYPDVLTATAEQISEHLKKHKIKGIGPAKSKILITAIPEFRADLMKFNKGDIKFALEHEKKRLEELKTKGYNEKIKGKGFVLTGFLGNPDYDLEDYIWDNLGNIYKTVTSNTTAVVSGNINNITGKMFTANELGVPVYSIAEFVDAFDVPLKADDKEPKMVVNDCPNE
jgi:DNA ligase (NAD+)